MKSASFKWLGAESPEEAVSALAELGEGAKILAGGQSLLPMMNLRLVQPEVLIDLGGAGMTGISAVKPLEIGAMTTQTEALYSPGVLERAPLLARALADVSHHALRNRGTVGGSVVHADPSAELPAALVALEAELVVVGPSGRRTIHADDFFVSHFTTVLEEDEVLVKIRIGRPRASCFAFYEVCRRYGDYALAGMAATFDVDKDRIIESTRLVLFGVDARPLRATEAERALVGTRLGDPVAISNASEAAHATVNPTGNSQGSAEYRRRVTPIAVRRGLEEAARGVVNG